MIRSHVSIRDSLVVLLTLTTGAVDVTSFLALGNVFSSVVTGHLVPRPRQRLQQRGHR